MIIFSFFSSTLTSFSFYILFLVLICFFSNISFYLLTFSEDNGSLKCISILSLSSFISTSLAIIKHKITLQLLVAVHIYEVRPGQDKTRLQRNGVGCLVTCLKASLKLLKYQILPVNLQCLEYLKTLSYMILLFHKVKGFTDC